MEENLPTPSYPVQQQRQIFTDYPSQVIITVPARSNPVFASFRDCETRPGALRFPASVRRGDVSCTLSSLKKRVYQ